MKLMVLAAVMGSMLMEEAEASASAGGAAEADGTKLAAFKLQLTDTAVRMRAGGEYEGREDYVVHGMAHHFGLPPDEVRDALHAEMAKVDAEFAQMAKDAENAPPSPHLDRNTAAAAGGGETPDPVVEVVTAGVDSSDEYALACADGKPKVALVGKYQDQVPVQLRDKHHLAKLVAEHGEGNVVVQS